jgi:hypothetical protein
MASPLTHPNLLQALKSNKSYKSTQPFLSAIAEDNATVMPTISKVFLELLTSEKADLMAKLLVLRMYKDIFAIGNMRLFLMLDPQLYGIIEEAAAYNSEVSPAELPTRGSSFFI